MGKIEQRINGVLIDVFSLLPILLLCSLLVLPISCWVVFGLGNTIKGGPATDAQCLKKLWLALAVAFVLGVAVMFSWTKIRHRPLLWRQVVLGVLGCALVFAVIGVALPNLDACHIDEGRAKRTMADMKTLAKILEDAKSENGEYPNARSTADLVFFVPEMRPSIGGIKDGWGNGFRVISSKEGYWIISAGGDGELDVPRFDQYPIDKLDWPGSDFVMHNSSWVQNPFLEVHLRP